MSKIITIEVKNNKFQLSSQNLSDYAPSTKPMFDKLIKELEKIRKKKHIFKYIFGIFGIFSLLAFLICMILFFINTNNFLFLALFIIFHILTWVFAYGFAFNKDSVLKEVADIIFNKNKIKFNQFYIVNDNTPWSRKAGNDNENGNVTLIYSYSNNVKLVKYKRFDTTVYTFKPKSDQITTQQNLNRLVVDKNFNFNNLINKNLPLTSDNNEKKNITKKTSNNINHFNKDIPLPNIFNNINNQQNYPLPINNNKNQQKINNNDMNNCKEQLMTNSRTIDNKKEMEGNPDDDKDNKV